MNFTHLVETLEQLAQTPHQEEIACLDASFWEQVKALPLLKGTVEEVIKE